MARVEWRLLVALAMVGLIGQQLWSFWVVMAPYYDQISRSVDATATSILQNLPYSSFSPDNGTSGDDQMVAYWTRKYSQHYQEWFGKESGEKIIGARTIMRPNANKDVVPIVRIVTSRKNFLELLRKQFPGAKTTPSYTFRDNFDVQASKWNYMHDPQFIKKRNAPFSMPTSFDYYSVCAPPGKGPEGPNGYRILSSKVIVSGQNSHNNTTSSSSGSFSHIKIFCAIYTYHGATDRLDAIAETWGKRCDGFMGASTVTNQTAGVVNLYHRGKPGDYRSIWQKVRSILVYIYLHYLEDYDFFYLMGDDTYLIVENLRSFLGKMTEGQKDPFVYTGVGVFPHGWRTYLPHNFYYAGGGSGYTLSRAAVKAFVENILFSCEADQTRSSEEDLFMGWCMRQVLNTTMMNDVDWRGEHRYHGFDAELMYIWPNLAAKGKTLGVFFAKQLRQHNIVLRKDSLAKRYMRSTSENSVAFHGIKQAAKTRRYEKLLYRQEINDCVCNNDREPGYPIAESLQGHLGCEWDDRTFAYKNLTMCESWQKLKEVTMPPGCNYQEAKGDG